jgi:hypothetical protein
VRRIFQGWRATSGRALRRILPDKSVKRGCALKRLAGLLALALGLAEPAVAGDLPTVAVVDFISTNGPVDSAMLGAADLLEAELSRYDVRVISRRELNLLRGERGLARSGFARLEDFQGRALPWADFLLRGEYQYGAGEAGVRFRLVDAATGTERGSWQLLVERPSDLVKNLDPILPKIAAAVCGKNVAAPRPRNQPGFTTIPEAASTFYHGVDHLVAGRPEYAAEYFRIAAASDAGFSLAVLGQTKAYEQLGFPGVANALRGTIPTGQLPQAQAAGTSAVLTVRFVDRTDTFTAGQMQRIRDALQETHGFALFEPDWIPALTRETDLKLSQDFPLVHGLDHRLWLRADHFIVFSAEKKGLSASVIDLLHGQLLGTVSGGSTNLDGLCAQAVAIIRRPDPAAPDTSMARTSNTNGPAAKLIMKYSVDEVAFAMRRLADQPKELARWVHLLWVMQPERLPPEVYHAFLDAYEAAIPPDAPDASVLLANVLWTRYDFDRFVQQPDDLPDIESHFAPLLKRYPDSLQAQVIRFQIARFFADAGERGRSWELAIEAAEKTAPLLLAMYDFIPLRGQYLDCIKFADIWLSFPQVIGPEGPRMRLLACDIFALAAYRSVGAHDLTSAQVYLAKAEQLARQTAGPREGIHFGGPVSFYPVSTVLWQSDTMFDWRPPDPADEGRMLVGWTIMPYSLHTNLPTVAAALSTDTLLRRTREALEGAKVIGQKAQAPSRSVISASGDNRSPREIWQVLLSAYTNSPQTAGYFTFNSGFAFLEGACLKQRDEQGAAAAVKFAEEVLADVRAASQSFVGVHGEIASGNLVMPFYWLAAQLALEAGEPGKAWAFTQQALAWRGRDEFKAFLRYQAAMAAWKAGHDDTAALILRALAEGPRAKDQALLLPALLPTPTHVLKMEYIDGLHYMRPFKPVRLRSVYLESVDLLEKVRAGAAPDLRPTAIDLTPVPPYFIGGTCPVAGPPKKRRRSEERPIDAAWAKEVAAWRKSMEARASVIRYEPDLKPESYEAWPEIDDRLPPKPPPPRFGQPYVCILEDEVGIEFVWIDSLRLWAAKYELTEDAWCYAMTERETGGSLPQNVSYEESMKVCASLNERERGRLPDGYCYRMPTVAEWEKLARCGTNRIYPWGNSMPPTFGNYCDQTYADAVDARGGGPVNWHIAGYRDGYEELAPVEDSGANEWGLHGMGGNLMDWATSPTGDHVMKGGLWFFSGDRLRVDAGIKEGEGPNKVALRCVLAPEIKPATPAH